MTYEEFKKQLTRETKGAFVFYGDEDYLKRDAVKLARKAIIADPTFAEFCHAVVTDGDIQRAREELSYPTMFSSDPLYPYAASSHYGNMPRLVTSRRQH